MYSTVWAWTPPTVWITATTHWQAGLQISVILPPEANEEIIAQCEALRGQK